MEAYKGDTLQNIFDRMAIVTLFPRQVVVLRGTRVACGLRGKVAGLQRRLIDERQTNEFADYSRHLRAAQTGNRGYNRQLLDLGKAATEHLTKLLKDADTVSSALIGVAASFTKDERRLVRIGESYSATMIDKLVKQVMEIAVHVFKDHPNVTALPTYAELPNTFIFRSSLCMYLLALHWAAHGGADNVGSAKMRNDMIDMYVAAFATFFDGLMSTDKKACHLHREARLILMAAFDCKLPNGLGFLPSSLSA
jgi:hypothetical protein